MRALQRELAFLLLQRCAGPPPRLSRHAADLKTDTAQVARSPYKGVWDCVSRTLRAEGIGAFYRSYRTTVRPVDCFCVHAPTGDKPRLVCAEPCLRAGRSS